MKITLKGLVLSGFLFPYKIKVVFLLSSKRVRTGAVKISRKGMRRLDIWLPEEHPIFNYPDGSRTQVARTWLDIGQRLLNIENNVSKIKEKVQNVEINDTDNEIPEDTNINAVAYIDAIEKVFG